LKARDFEINNDLGNCHLDTGGGPLFLAVSHVAGLSLISRHFFQVYNITRNQLVVLYKWCIKSPFSKKKTRTGATPSPVKS
jgi:hypothetical protein